MALRGHWGTWVYGHLRTRTILDRHSGTTRTQTLEHLVSSITWALGHLRYLETWTLSCIGLIATIALGHSARKALRHSRNSRLVCDILGYSSFEKESWKHIEGEDKKNFSKVCLISGKTYSEECIMETGAYSSMFLRRFPAATLCKKMWPQITYLHLK